jgi:xanthine dehydrogenase accessory factor
VRDIADNLLAWWESGQTVGVGTVVATFDSAPRQPGAAMLVAPDGTVVGSVSGGCVEGAVYELATSVAEGAPPTLQRYGVSDDDAFAVGLTCGGVIDVFVEAISRASFAELGGVIADLREHRPVAVATLVDGDEARRGRRLVVWPDRVSGSLGAEGLDVAVTDDARGMLATGRTGIRRYGPDGERRVDEVGVFVASYAPPPRMIVFGAIDFAAAVARIGKFLGYHVTVCDARPVFATKKRFPDADEVVVEWPHKYLTRTATDERTVVCVLTHDPKFDGPLLEVALRKPAAYIGAMGSRRTHEKRLAQLRQAGLADAEIDRLSSPVGLDLGARTPEETAVSVAAEIIANQWGGSGRRLADLTARIHHDPGDEPRPPGA